jgi:hypothetical protein
MSKTRSDQERQMRIEILRRTTTMSLALALRQMWRSRRYRMPANDFAIPRMEPGKQRPIQSMEEACVWERLFIGKAGRDPKRGPTRAIHVNTRLGDVSVFLDAYLERYVKPAGLRSIDAICSWIGVLKQHLGHVPLAALEEPDDLNQFKTDSDYAEDVELATMHRVLERLRAAINWAWPRRRRGLRRHRSTASVCG